MATENGGAAPAGGEIASGSHGGFEVSTNTETQADVQKTLETAHPDAKGGEGDDDEGTRVRKAASTLGKKGGAAAAAARAAAGKTRPAPADKEGDAEPDADGEQDDDEAGDEAGDDGDEQPTGHRRKDARARMLAATQREAAAKAERDRLAAENAELRRQIDAGKSKPKAGEQERPAAGEGDDDPEPEEDSFATHKEYVRELAKWSGRQEVRKTQAAEHQRQESTAYAHHVTTRVQTFEKRVQKAIEAGGDPSVEERIPAFRDVLVNTTHMLPDGVQQTAFNVINDEIIDSENPLGLMLYLGQHPDVMRKLTAMPPGIAISKAIARIEAYIEASAGGGDEDEGGDEPPPARTPASNAKPPLRGLAPSAPSGETDEPAGSFDEHYKRAQREDAKRRAARR